MLLTGVLDAHGAGIEDEEGRRPITEGIGQRAGSVRLRDVFAGHVIFGRQGHGWGVHTLVLPVGLQGQADSLGCEAELLWRPTG
jgi:hypothetical protein